MLSHMVVMMGAFFSTLLDAQEVVIQNLSGDSYVIEIQSEASFTGAINSIKEYVAIVENVKSSFGSHYVANVNAFNMYVTNDQITVKAVAPQANAPRDYNVAPSEQDKKDISFIVTSLANSSLLKLGTLKSSLESAGDRVDPVHPLQFVAFIFSNEELKTGMHNMEHNGGYVWKKFMGGLADTLTEENGLNNILNHSQDFAKKVKINENLILPTLKAGQWEAFIKVLIDNIPRQGNTSRYSN